jgi:hypothetical protein
VSRYSWISNLFPAQRHADRKSPASRRLAVEALEDRATPAAIGLSAPEVYVEDTPLNLVDIVVSGTLNATATLTLSNTAAGSLSTATSGTVTSSYDADAGVWTAMGPVADVNALLADLVFTPSPDFNADLHIATSISDDTGISTGDKLVTATPVNDQPTANDQSISTNEEVAVPGILTGDDRDPEATQALTFAIVSQPSNGSLTLDTATGAFNNTPHPNYTGPDSFTFTVTDDDTAGGPALTSAAATISITVSGVNNQPTANDQSITTDEGVAFTGTLTGDDGDPEVTQALTFAIASPPSHGTVSLDQDTGAFTYTPAADYNGPDSFTFTVTDDDTASGPALTSAPGTVSIHVLSPGEQVAALRQMVQDLAAAGAFKNKGRLNSLLTKLRQIDAALAKDHGKVAYNVAGAFINDVRAFRRARILTAAQADPLIAAATQLRTSLSIGLK